jgi:hypothetical protein
VTASGGTYAPEMAKLEVLDREVLSKLDYGQGKSREEESWGSISGLAIGMLLLPAAVLVLVAVLLL